MRNVTIVESNVEPNKEHLWFYNGKLKWFGPNGWEEINPQVLSPTTTPKPVVSTTTTTSTPSPITTTSTAPSTFKLINSTGETVDVEVEAGSFTVPNGGSLLVLRSNGYVNLKSYTSSKVCIIVDGEDKGELSHSSSGGYLYVIPQSIYMAATEISVYYRADS